MAERPLAFVIMPFGDDFDYVYVDFIKRVLEEAGLDVDRADDIENQQTILRTVVDKIYNSDLVIADLTTSNPNVFYELGIAHTMKKPVIHITQSIGAVPFDLKSQRLLEYSTHFVKIKSAEKILINYAQKFLKGEIIFGNPVTDFLPDNVPMSSMTPESTPLDIIPDDRGYLDHLIDINNDYSRLAGIIEGVTQDLSEMNGSVTDANEELERISASKSSSLPVAVQGICRRLAKRIAVFTGRLKLANAEYATIAQNSEDSLEIVVSFQRQQRQAEESEVEEQLSSLREVLISATNGRDAFLGMAETMDAVPRMERHLNAEVARASEEVRVMAGNIERTVASINRALQA